MTKDHYLTDCHEKTSGHEAVCTCGWSSGGVNRMTVALARFMDHHREETENARRPALGPDGGKGQT